MSYFEYLLNTHIKNNWEYTLNEEDQIIFMRIQTNVSECTLVSTSNEDDELIHIFARLSEFWPPNKRSESIALMNKLNFLLNVGTWTLDEEDGEVRFRLIQAYLQPPKVEEIEMLLSFVVSGYDSFAGQLISYFKDEMSIEQTHQALDDLFDSKAM